jgi:hypothetical protein
MTDKSYAKKKDYSIEKPEPVKGTRFLDWTATDKQIEALDYLEDMVTDELVFGGAAGGAKSFLGCAWLISNCYKYKESRWLLGRAKLKQLKQSTLLTFFDVCRQWGLRKDLDYNYNSQDGVITFFQTKSQVYLKDLFAYPADPDFDSLGSTEYTGAFIDEASQITGKAKNIVKSRLRYKIDDYGILGKLLMTANPSKNFLYLEFYKPWKENKLPLNKVFLPSKVVDNPFLPDSYIENLKGLDPITKARLLNGDWEYSNDPAALMEFDTITNIFSTLITYADGTREKDENGQEVPDPRPKYLVCDVARFGEDLTVITRWKGLECVQIETFKRTSTTTVAGLLQDRAEKYGIPAANILVDEDGVGGGVKDQLYGIKGFVANSRPRRKENYANFKAQCAYRLAKRINAGELAVTIRDPALRERLVEELEQIKAKDIDKDGKLAILSKDKAKEVLGRSPDLGDCFIMRMAFEFAPTPKLTWV